MPASEIIFEVNESPEGGYEARGLGYGIYTEADTWEQLCSTSVTRLYHATAALLPDGRVLVAGHDGPFNMPPFDSSEYRLETYSPPYLFRGPRPVIGGAPSAIWCSTAFVIDTPAPAEIDRVVLIRQGSITHQTNTDQRYVGINFERRADRLICSAPPDSAVAPPGHYMLFLVNRRGVPSVASWVQVRH